MVEGETCMITYNDCDKWAVLMICPSCNSTDHRLSCRRPVSVQMPPLIHIMTITLHHLRQLKFKYKFPSDLRDHQWIAFVGTDACHWESSSASFRRGSFIKHQVVHYQTQLCHDKVIPTVKHAVLQPLSLVQHFVPLWDDQGCPCLSYCCNSKCKSIA